MEHMLNSMPPDGAAAQKQYEAELKTSSQTIAKPVLCAGYSTADALEISNTYINIEKPFDKFRYITRCSGIKLVIKEKRYWFEFFGKQITATDFYMGESFKHILHAACT